MNFICPHCGKPATNQFRITGKNSKQRAWHNACYDQVFPPGLDVKRQVANLIHFHGAHATILALSQALADLGPEWQGENGAAVGVEAITGYAPCRDDDWKSHKT